MVLSTTQAIIITQIPIAVAILILAYEVFKTKKEFLNLLDKLVEVNKKKKE